MAGPDKQLQMLNALVQALPDGELKTIMMRVGSMFRAANGQLDAHIAENVNDLQQLRLHARDDGGTRQCHRRPAKKGRSGGPTRTRNSH